MKRLTPRFSAQQCKIFGEMFYPNLKKFLWRRHPGAHPDGLQHGGWKHNKYDWVLLQKREFVSRGTQEH